MLSFKEICTLVSYFPTAKTYLLIFHIVDRRDWGQGQGRELDLMEISLITNFTSLPPCAGPVLISILDCRRNVCTTLQSTDFADGPLSPVSPFDHKLFPVRLKSSL